MKKLLIGLFAASTLAASVAGYAGTVTFVNRYSEPVMFIVSLGPVYNPIAEGTVPSGGQYTYPINGPLTRDLFFFASPLHQPLVTVNCGRTYGVMDSVIMKAGWTQFGEWGWSDNFGYDGTFSCRLFAPAEGAYGPMVPHRHHYRTY